jgi:hypothetical protein
VLCLHQGIVEPHLAIEIAICGTLQFLQLQDLGQERWEGECIELYMNHSNNARETSDPNETSPSPSSQLSWSQARLARRQGVLIGETQQSGIRVARKVRCFSHRRATFHHGIIRSIAFKRGVIKAACQMNSLTTWVWRSRPAFCHSNQLSPLFGGTWYDI